METDHTRRLVKLISLVAYAEGDRCGLRWRSGTAPDLAKDHAVRAHQMCMYYAGALQCVQSDGREGCQDYRELVEFTLPFVTNADAEVEQLLGAILVNSLCLLDETNPRVIGRKWLDDVLDACWEGKIATAPELYGVER